MWRVTQWSTLPACGSDCALRASRIDFWRLVFLKKHFKFQSWKKCVATRDFSFFSRVCGFFLPLGAAHTLRWNSWGRTLDDFAAIGDKPRRWWQALGIGVAAVSGHHPWTVLDDIALMWKDAGEKAHATAGDFGDAHLQNLARQVLFCALGGLAVCLAVLVPLALVIWACARRNHSPKEKVAQWNEGHARC